MSETGNSNRIREHFSLRGERLFRCNTGVLRDKNDRPVRFGLANDSAEMNRQIKPGDLIGYVPTLITPEMVGDVIARFKSVEVKADGWRFPRPTNKADYAHCMAQLRWANMITSEGGEAGFMIDPLRGYEPI